MLNTIMSHYEYPLQKAGTFDISSCLDCHAQAAPFRAVEVVTLREDWEGKRVLAEARIRDIMTRGSEAGTVIVIPFRVAGFGPYADVLEGFEYAADGTGLLPHDGMADWVFGTGRNVACREGWTTSQCH